MPVVKVSKGIKDVEVGQVIEAITTADVASRALQGKL